MSRLLSYTVFAALTLGGFVALGGDIDPRAHVVVRDSNVVLVQQAPRARDVDALANSPTENTKHFSVTNAGNTHLVFSSTSRMLFTRCVNATSGVPVFIVNQADTDTANGEGPFCDSCAGGSALPPLGDAFLRSSVAGPADVRCGFVETWPGGMSFSSAGGSSATLFPLLAPDGSITAPSYSFASDATEGMWTGVDPVGGSGFPSLILSAGVDDEINFDAHFFQFGRANDHTAAFVVSGQLFGFGGAVGAPVFVPDGVNAASDGMWFGDPFTTLSSGLVLDAGDPTNPIYMRGRTYGPSGSNALPTYSFAGSAAIGMYKCAASKGNLCLSGGSASGNVAVNHDQVDLQAGADFAVSGGLNVFNVLVQSTSLTLGASIDTRNSVGDDAIFTTTGTTGASIAGATRARAAVIQTNTPGGMVINEFAAQPIIIATNNTPRVTVAAGGDVTLTGHELLADGAAGTPALAFANLTDTGLFRSGGSGIGVTVGGTERVRITSSSIIPVTDNSVSLGLAATPLGFSQVFGHKLLGANAGSDATNDFVQFPRAIHAGAVTKPACASSSDAGKVVYLDDTTDAFKGELCLCTALADGTTYTWLSIQGDKGCDL